MRSAALVVGGALLGAVLVLTLTTSSPAPDPAAAYRDGYSHGWSDVMYELDIGQPGPPGPDGTGGSP